jgi:uncharacterized protein YcbK (DUF882 family)
VNFSFDNRRARGLWAGVLTAMVFALIGVPSAFAQLHDDASPGGELSLAPNDANGRDVRRDVRSIVGDSLFGQSGALRARFVALDAVSSLPVLQSLFEDSLIARPALLPVKEANGEPGFHFITMRRFADKVSGRIGAYRIGNWSAERGAPRSLAYKLPEGFIEVTAENQHTQVSEHFQLRDFLTKDQAQVWPKYLVLRESLIDKLELLIAELEAEGLVGYEMVVMSGFRTPQYNAQGVGAGGRASESRHQFGDAADVYLRRATPGARDWMPDITGDGRSDTKDALRVARAAERVEARHPALVGGIGVYPATSAHGPFVHIDVRGDAARWGQW